MNAPRQLCDCRGAFAFDGLVISFRQDYPVPTSGRPYGLRCESEPVEPEPASTGGGEVWMSPVPDPVRRDGDRDEIDFPFRRTVFNKRGRCRSAGVVGLNL